MTVDVELLVSASGNVLLLPTTTVPKSRVGTVTTTLPLAPLPFVPPDRL